MTALSNAHCWTEWEGGTCPHERDEEVDVNDARSKPTADEGVLRDDRVYIDNDRFVCSEVRCAGSTAKFTGRGLGGARLVVVEPRDVTEWASHRAEWEALGMEMPDLGCECGRLVATGIAASGGGALTREVER